MRGLLQAEPLPPAHSWRRNFVDLERTFAPRPAAVEGRLPEGLNGRVDFVGPGRFTLAGRRYRHWFDGDGAVLSVGFGGGRATACLQEVAARRLSEERQSGGQRLERYGTPAQRPLLGRLAAGVANAANTSMLHWQGRTFALFEAGRPTELDPETLATLGETDLGGVLGSTFSAHPHRVPPHRTTYGFGQRVFGPPAVRLYALPDVGPARRLGNCPLPFTGMVHDFAVTERWMVLLLPPVRLRWSRILRESCSFRDALIWEPERGTEIVLLPLGPGRPVRLQTEAFFFWHTLNAFDAPQGPVVDLVGYPDFGSEGWLGTLPHAVPEHPAAGTLQRLRVDVASRRVSRESLWDGAAEFPQLSPLRAAAPERFAYVTTPGSAEAARGMFDGVAKVDLRRGTSQRFALGPALYPSEPVFVPRPGGSGEDDGWILTLVYDGVSDLSHLEVLDARVPARPAIARVRLGARVPFAFHGRFLSSALSVPRAASSARGSAG